MSKKKKTRMGRPPLPKGQVKDIQIVIRLTPAFHEALCAAAKKAGESLAGFVRSTLEDKLTEEG